MNWRAVAIARMRTPSRRQAGHALALAGAAGLVADTWAPWYRLVVPSWLAARVDVLTHRLGPTLAAGVREQLRFIGAHHSLGVSARVALPLIDVELVGLAVIVALVVACGRWLAKTAGAPGREAVIVSGVGMLACGLVVFRMVVPPVTPSLAILAPGVWLALAASLVIVLGGLLLRPLPAPVPAAERPLWAW